MNNDYMAEFYLEKAYYIDTKDKNKVDNIKLYQRGEKEYPKYSVHGLKVKSSYTARALSELNVGESYKDYKRVF